MPARLGLDQIQRWMHAVVVHPGATLEAVASANARAEAASAADVILPSRTLAPVERVAIYQRMYPLRMLDALSTDYPTLKQFLGDSRFARLVAAYVEAYPSRSYTLNRLSDHVPG